MKNNRTEEGRQCRSARRGERERTGDEDGTDDRAEESCSGGGTCAARVDGGGKAEDPDTPPCESDQLSRLRRRRVRTKEDLAEEVGVASVVLRKELARQGEEGRGRTQTPLSLIDPRGGLLDL